MGPDISVFRETVRRVWSHIEQLERELKEWKAEAHRSKWPREAAQEYFALRAMLPKEIGEDTYLGMPRQLQALYEAIHEDQSPTLERCFRRKGLQT
jgi:hypothetical protein